MIIRDKFLYLARELKKLQNLKVMIIPIVIGALGTVPKGLVRGLKELEIGGQAKKSIFMINQNTEKSLRVLRKLADTQITLV